jgi:hypothetical protein
MRNTGAIQNGLELLSLSELGLLGHKVGQCFQVPAIGADLRGFLPILGQPS